MKKTGQEVKGHVQPLGGSVNTASGGKPTRTGSVTAGSGLKTGTAGGKGNSGPAPSKGFRNTGQENGGGGYAG